MNPRRLLGLALLVLPLGGCGYQGVTSLPLPGAISGSDTYQVSVVLDDAAQLVPNETCRANDVVVGSVQAVTVGPDLRAHVTCAIDSSVRLPANTVATLKQTSLLGERFVALDPPPGAAPTGQLAEGAVVPNSATGTDPDTEQVLGALSMVLNGGSLGRIQTISTELNHALAGHETDTRALLDKLTSLTSELDQHKNDITHALDSLDRLSGTVADQRDVLGRALDTVPGGLRVLNEQRSQVLALLTHLSELSGTAVPVIRASADNTVADLRALNPILGNLAKNGRQIAPALEMLSYPFPANALSAIKGDYAGLFATVNFDQNTIITLLQQQATAPLSNRVDLPPRSPSSAAPASSHPPLPGPLTSPTNPLERLLTGGGG